MLRCLQRPADICMYAFLNERKYKKVSLVTKNGNRFLASCPSCGSSDLSYMDCIKVLRYLRDDVPPVDNLWNCLKLLNLCILPLSRMILSALYQSCSLEIQPDCIFPISLHFPSITVQLRGSPTDSCSTAVTAVRSLDARGLETLKEQLRCGLPDVSEPPVNCKSRGITVKRWSEIKFYSHKQIGKDYEIDGRA